mgnify:FL=1
MSYTLAGKSAEKCRNDYFQVKSKGSMLEIIFIKTDLYGNRQVVPAVYLRPARDARHEQMNAFAGPHFDEVVLIKKRWPRSNKTHIPFQDAEKLWQFVKAESPQDSADSRYILLGRCQQVGGHRRRFDLHGPELRHRED